MIQNKTQSELVNLGFTYANSFKRHRALAQIKKYEGDTDQSNYHNMKTYEMFDNLELTLRAIQRGMKEEATQE